MTSLQSDFQDRQGYIEKLCLGKKRCLSFLTLYKNFPAYVYMYVSGDLGAQNVLDSLELEVGDVCRSPCGFGNWELKVDPLQGP